MNELEMLRAELVGHVRLNPGELASRARLCRLVEFGREYPEERAMTDEERRKANGQRARAGLVSRWVEVGVLSLFLAAGTIGFGQSLTNAWWDGNTLRLQFDSPYSDGIDVFDLTTQWEVRTDAGHAPQTDWTIGPSDWQWQFSSFPMIDGPYGIWNGNASVQLSTFSVSDGVGGQIGNFQGPVVPEATPLAFGLASLLMLFRSSGRGFRGGQLFSCSWLRCLGSGGYSGEWLSRKEVID